MSQRGGFGGGMGNIGNMMKQAQAMQQRLEKVQAEVALKTAEGTAGGGMVKVIANGKNEILSITINKEVVNADEVEMLQEMVLGATNQALKNIQTLVTDAMKQVTGGLNIPGLL